MAGHYTGALKNTGVDCDGSEQAELSINIVGSHQRINSSALCCDTKLPLGFNPEPIMF
jgi:hypothetical protein